MATPALEFDVAVPPGAENLPGKPANDAERLLGHPVPVAGHRRFRD
jgi:hypothetical protein